MAASDMDINMSKGSITVTRAASYGDKLRNYTVVIDGEVAGHIGNGESIRFPVSVGDHELFLRIAWCRSQALLIHVRPEAEVRLVCEPAANAATVLYWMTFGYRRYIDLRIAE